MVRYALMIMKRKLERAQIGKTVPQLCSKMEMTATVDAALTIQVLLYVVLFFP